MVINNIGPDTVLQRKTDLLFNEIDGELVMLSLENNEYYGMDEVASRIWTLLEKPIIFKELINKLLEEYEVLEPHCIEKTLSFLNTLSNKKLIITE